MYLPSSSPILSAIIRAMTNKIIETFTFSVTAFNFQQSDSVFAGLIAGYKMNIVIMISNLAHLMDHNKAYTDTIEKNFEDNNDTLKIMSAFLQTD